MRKIQLSQGKYAFVDDKNYKKLSKYKWHAQKFGKYWYATRTEVVLMHRQIMGLKKGNPLLVDHKDRDGLNNQKKNLRSCTKSQHQHTQKRKGTGVSKYRGVSWNKKRKRWQAKIQFQGKTIMIGSFKNEKQAALAYDNKAKELFNEFAFSNFK